MFTSQTSPGGQSIPNSVTTPLGDSSRPPKRRRRLLIGLGFVLLSLIGIWLYFYYQETEQVMLAGSIAAKNLEKEKKPFPGMEMLNPEAKSPPSSGVTIEPPPTPVEPVKPAIVQPSIGQPFSEKPAFKPKSVKGEAFTRALIKAMDDQANRSFLGWRPDSILFGKLGLTDDVNNLQLGVLEVARRTVVVLNENMSRFALTEAQNRFLNNAMNLLCPGGRFGNGRHFGGGKRRLR
jgi:hypothetical protein